MTESIIYTQDQIDERAKILRDWLDDHKALRDRFSGKMYRDIDSSVGLINEVASLGVPTANKAGQWGIHRWDTSANGFYIVPLLPQDAKIHPFFERAARTAYYHEGARAIFLPLHNIKPEWRGVLLEHELCHAVAHHFKRHRRKKLGYWIEEYEAYRAESWLVRKLYGRTYGDAVYRLAKKLEPGLRNKNLQIKDRQLVSDDLITHIFGPPASAYEASSQRGLLILDAIYHAIDRVYPDGPSRNRRSYDVTFWFCSPASYKKYKEERQRLKAQRSAVKRSLAM